MNDSTVPSQPGAATAEQPDPAVEFLSQLLPREPGVRKRAFSALLRALVVDRSGS